MDDYVASMISESEIDLNKFNEERSVLYMILPDEKTTFYGLCSLFVNQVYTKLVELADSKGGRLKIRTNFILELKLFYNVLKSGTDKRFKIPYTTMNIGKMDGGKSINIVPNSCITYIDFRVMNNGHRQKIFEEINRLKEKYQFEYEIINDIRPFITESEKCKTTNFITEASFIQAKNRYILGTGPINLHEANEYITIESLDRLVVQYKKIINELCCMD